MNTIAFTSGFSGGVKIAGDIAAAVKGEMTASLLEYINSGGIIETNLIGSGTSADALTGTFSLGGKLFTATIPEDLYNEFILGRTFGGGFAMPVKLQLSGVNNAGGGEEIVFKIINDLNSGDILKAIDLYNKVYSDGIGAAVKTFFASGINPAEIPQNLTVSVKGNFLFIHMNFGTASGSGSVILTSDPSYRIKDGGGRKSANVYRKPYMFMLETELDPLGHIKLFSYYLDKSLSVNFHNCPLKAKELINKNLDLFKEMLSLGGIALKDVAFRENPGEGLNGGAAQAAFSGGKIIDERI